MTARPAALLALAALATFGCSLSHESRNGGEVLETPSGLGRILVAPLNLAISPPGGLEGAADTVWSELLRYFQERDRNPAVLAPSEAELLWREVMASLEPGDPDRDLRTASARFARGIAEQADYDVLVMPSLLLREVRVHGREAHWDGVHRMIPVRDPRLDLGLDDVAYPDGWVSIPRFQGHLAATSLHVLLLRSDGEAVYEGLAGLDLLHEAGRAQQSPNEGWKLELRAQPFADPRLLRDGIERAFERSVAQTARAR